MYKNISFSIIVILATTLLLSADAPETANLNR